MKKLDNIKIAKELIFLAGTYNAKKKKEDKQLILDKIAGFKKEINMDEKNYTTVLSFIEDIQNDLLY